MEVSLGAWAVMNNTDGLAHSNQDATPQIIVTTRAGRRHRDPIDYEHPYGMGSVPHIDIFYGQRPVIRGDLRDEGLHSKGTS